MNLIAAVRARRDPGRSKLGSSMPRHEHDRSGTGEPEESRYRRFLPGEWEFRRLIVVVAGILIAFALDSWWNGRTEDVESHDYLIELRDDFLENRQRLDSVAAVLGSVQRGGGELLHAAETSANRPSTDSLSALVATTFRLAGFHAVTSAYDNLINARDITLVPGEDLRLSLAAFTTQSFWLREVERWQNEQWIFVNQPYLNSLIEVSDLSEHWLDAHTQARLPHGRFSTDWEAVLSDRRFRNIVMQRVIAAEDMIQTLRIVRQQIERILALLDGALDH